MYSIVTALFYFIPVTVSLYRQPFSCRTIFFIYTLMGAWLYGLFLEYGILPEEHLIANWVLNIDSLPWLEFAFLNFFIFILTHPYPVQNKAEGNIAFGVIKTPDNYGVLIAMACFALFAEIAYTLLVYGGVKEFIHASYFRQAIDDTRINMIFPLLLFVNTLIPFVYAVVRYCELPQKIKILAYTFVAIQLIYTLLAGGRSILMLIVVGLVIVHYGSLRNIRWSIILGFGSAFMLLSGLMIYQRLETQSAIQRVNLNVTSLVEASYTGLPMIDHLALSREYVTREGHDMGKTYLNAPLLFIPRAIWPGKPEQLSKNVRYVFWGDDSGGIPPGLFGESYIAFGWLGVIMAGILFARLLVIVDRFIDAGHVPLLSLVRRAIFPPIIGFILVRGGIDIGIYRVGMVIVMYFIIERLLWKKVQLG